MLINQEASALKKYDVLVRELKGTEHSVWNYKLAVAHTLSWHSNSTF